MKDIEVFILTYNRIDLLKKSMQSILNQTHEVRLTIVDNASTDDTQTYVEEIQKQYPNVYYIKQNTHVDFQKNFNTAKSAAVADYVMFFHDDDILHPQYIETAHKLVNQYDNVDLVCGLLTVFSDDEEINIKTTNIVKYSCFETKEDFVSHCFSAFHTDNSSIMFPHIIYKTKNIKNIDIKSDIYGKIADKPFVIESIKDGKCIQIRNRDMMFYRVHKGQDSATSQNGPFPQEIYEHTKFFKQYMTTNENKKKYKVFAISWLMNLYNWGGNDKSKTGVKNFIKEAYNQKVIGKYEYQLSMGPFKLVRKKWNRILFKQYEKSDKNIKEYDLPMETTKQ